MASTEAQKHVYEDDAGDLVVLLKLPAVKAREASEEGPAVKARPAGTYEYIVEDVDAETGRWAVRLFQKSQAAQRRHDAGETAEDIDADLHLSDEAEKDLYGKVLGATLDQLAADGVKWKKTQLLGQIAYAWIVRGVEGAQGVWESDGAPKANREARRAATRASGSRTRTGGAAAKRTSTASTRGTSR
jgi:hypothetical protein